MRHVFIVNPAAGKGEKSLQIADSVHAFFGQSRPNEDYQVYQTSGPADAERIARREAQRGQPVRLYAVGGDGTLCEVLNGMFGYQNAQLAHVPAGSANDFLRSWPQRDYTDIEAFVNGEVYPMDVIKFADRVALNTCCIGLDADVARKMVKYKNWPFVSGPAAYLLAVADVFFHRIGKELDVVIQAADGPVRRSGRFFFALAANGPYYGGGFKGAPAADPTDEQLNFVLVRKMSRLKVPFFLKKYKNGQPLPAWLREDFCGSRMSVVCKDGAVVAVDGECSVQTQAVFELLAHAVSFVLPAEKK